MPTPKPTAPIKKRFDVKLECLLPATLTYRILAESPEEAIRLIQRSQPTNIRHQIQGKRSIKATVYDAGTTLIRFIKNMAGSNQ